MRSSLSDLRLSVRRLASRPVGSLIAIVTLSLGIGAVSTMYLLFRAGTNDLPPVPEPNRIARVFVVDRSTGEPRIPPSTVERKAWLASPVPGLALAAISEGRVTVDPGAHSILAQRVSPRYFEVAGVAPVSGRVFAPGEKAVIVSHRLWEALPAGGRQLGSTLSVDGEDRMLIGVMPHGFWMPARGVDAWLPAGSDDENAQAYVVARVKRDSTPARAASALAPVVQGFRGSHHVVDVRLLATDAAIRSRTGMLMLVGPALLVLVMVSANVSTLVLSDVHGRRADRAVRAALGASPWRLGREVLADAAVLAVLGGALSLMGAFWSLRWLRAAFGAVSPELASALPGFAAAGPVALIASGATILGVGILPALTASRVRLASSLAGRSPAPVFRRGRYSSGDLLLVLQIATAAGLVLWTAAFTGVFNRLNTVPAHVPSDRVWSMSVAAREKPAGFGVETQARILDQARASPGIERAALSEPSGPRRPWAAGLGTRHNGTCTASLLRIRGDYFAVHGFPLFGSLPAAEELVINEVARSRCGEPEELRDSSGGGGPQRVSGHVDDRIIGASIPGRPRGPAVVYETLNSPFAAELVLHVRSRTPSIDEVLSLRARLMSVFPGAAISEPRRLSREIENGFAGPRLVGQLVGVLAALALVFGMVGVHGAIAQAVARRTEEIGIRIALGASPHHVVRETIGHYVGPTMAGLLLGLGVAVGGLSALGTDDASLIRELALLTARSPAVWAGLIGLLIVVSLGSAGQPVLKALRLDPATVLRAE